MKMGPQTERLLIIDDPIRELTDYQRAKVLYWEAKVARHLASSNPPKPREIPYNAHLSAHPFGPRF